MCGLNATRYTKLQDDVWINHNKTITIHVIIDNIATIAITILLTLIIIIILYFHHHKNIRKSSNGNEIIKITKQ